MTVLTGNLTIDKIHKHIRRVLDWETIKEDHSLANIARYIDLYLFVVIVIYNICEDWDLDFVGMFACTGLWNSFFLLIYSVTDASKLMKWCTR